MTKTCATCHGTSPDVKFSCNHRNCNGCRALKSRTYQAEYARKHRARNRENQRVKRQEYRAENPHLTFYSTSRYLANKASTYSDLTKEDALDIYETPDVCGYCGKAIDVSVKRSLHIDHIVPMSQGGVNSRWNLVKVCINCNTSKGDGSLVNYYGRCPDFTEQRYEAVVNEMVRLSGRTRAEIDEILTLSHSFEIAFQNGRRQMVGALRVLREEERIECAI
ncbi:HNH endonuclease [Paenibacillus abyssi]|uniref:HNH endonuclease n=1 Tax=Paenibacillus abyssi TaxID=1340531 RepID=UPI0016631694|nr:HNH endonuclease [Paenibacillus abyssi]